MYTNTGLRELPEDPRDFALGKVLDLPDPSTLPEHFVLPDTFGVKDQKDSDFCTQYALCAISGEQEGVELSPEWAFAMSKALEGEHETYGQDLRTACKVHVKYGGLPKKDSPYSLENKDYNFLRNPEVWPADLVDKAKPHKKQTYFKVTGPFDAFDNIRGAVYSLKDRAAIGVVWGWPNDEMFLDEPVSYGSGHALAVIGWDKEYLVVKQSYGPNAGKQGYVYISRKVINDNVDKYGAFMLTDLPKEAVPVEENETQLLFSQLADLIIKILRYFSLIRIGMVIDRVLFGKYLGSSFYPVPTWLRFYFDRLTKLRRIQVYSRLVDGVAFWRNAPPELACAESVTRILNLLFGFPVLTGTWTLLEKLLSSPKWLEIQHPVNGCVVLAATGTGKKGAIGHTGIFDSGRVWSNSSITGKWGSHHTIAQFVKYYQIERQMPVRYFIPIEV